MQHRPEEITPDSMEHVLRKRRARTQESAGAKRKIAKSPRAEAEGGQSLIASVINIKYYLLSQPALQDPEAGEMRKGIAAQWDEVKQALDDPEHDPSEAIETVQAALQDTEQRAKITKDRHAKENIEPLQQILTHLQKRKAA